MTHLRTLATLAALALLPACTDYATFVTATNIGINADVKTQDVSIGYGRAELFTGPGYPEQGEAPRAVGYINSDLHVFQPHIKQLYATGEAAELVTLPPLPSPPPQTLPPPSKPPEPDYYGQRRPLVFATGANVGLKLGFGAGTAPVPSSIKFGYNREEASVIPLRSELPTEQHRDRYASVLASMDMDLGGTAAQASTNLGITQFFATGSAARNLALHPDIQRFFHAQAVTAVSAAVERAVALTVDKENTNYDAIVAYFRNVPTAGFKVARDRLLADAGIPATSPRGRDLRATTNADALLSYLKDTDPSLIARLAPSARTLTGQR